MDARRSLDAQWTQRTETVRLRIRPSAAENAIQDQALAQIPFAPSTDTDDPKKRSPHDCLTDAVDRMSN